MLKLNITGIFITTLMAFLFISQSQSFTDMGKIEKPENTINVHKDNSLPINPSIDSTKLNTVYSNPIFAKVDNLYTNKKYHYKINYPINWEILEPPYLGTHVNLFISPFDSDTDIYQESFIISVDKIDRTKETLDTVFDSMLKHFNHTSPGTVNVIKKTNITISNCSALRISIDEIVIGSTSKTLKNEVVVIPIPGSTYTITFKIEPGKESQYLPVFEEMLSTFELL